MSYNIQFTSTNTKPWSVHRDGIYGAIKRFADRDDAADYMTVCMQRDDLLAALKNIADVPKVTHPDRWPSADTIAATASIAIAKVERGES